MPRFLFCGIVLFAFIPPAQAETTTTAAEMVIRLSVQPMPAPKPALRYLLLPELQEMTPGNPIPNYLRASLDQDFTAERETLNRSALRQADRAARMDKPDWQILIPLKRDGIGLLLPDVQKLRMLAAALQERFHEEVVQHRFDDALRTAKTMFALSRHMGEHPTLIGGLVGVAIASITIGPLEEMMEQPGCPNLYWALTNLPYPLISFSKGLEGERTMLQWLVRGLDDREPMSKEQLEKLISYLDGLFKQNGIADKKVLPMRAWIDARTRDEKSVQAARSRLIEYGISEERVRRFPADQVILLDARCQHELHRDEAMKLMNLPTWEFESRFHQLKPAKDESIFDLLIPTLEKIRRAQGRLEQRIALLRCVEAIRLYAAEHEGKFPDKLSDLNVPVPNDPFTGKPFRYEAVQGTAHLRGTPPHGAENMPPYNLHYEITLQKGSNR